MYKEEAMKYCLTTPAKDTLKVLAAVLGVIAFTTLVMWVIGSVSFIVSGGETKAGAIGEGATLLFIGCILAIILHHVFRTAVEANKALDRWCNTPKPPPKPPFKWPKIIERCDNKSNQKQ